MAEKWECFKRSKTYRAFGDSPKLDKVTEEKCSPEELNHLLKKMKEVSPGNVHFNMDNVRDMKKYRCVAKCNCENYGTIYCYNTQSITLEDVNYVLRRKNPFK